MIKKELNLKVDGHKHFSNTECPYYPCHSVEKLNCLFCFCPLYQHPDCGGNWTLFNSVKDCSNCDLPHNPDGWDKIIERLTKEAKKKA